MEDIDELVRTRIIVLRAANKLSDDVVMYVLGESVPLYGNESIRLSWGILKSI